MTNLTELEEKLSIARRIAVFGHVVPDADAIGSCLGLKQLIKSKYPTTTIDVFLPGGIGDLYSMLLSGVTINPNPAQRYDIAFVLDCPSISRTAEYEEIVKTADFVVNIDHHETNEKFGDVNFVAKRVTSTGELVYYVAKMLNMQFDDKSASDIYQAVLTDSNCFTSLSVTKNTHKIVSELLTYNFDANELKNWYFKSDSKAKMHLSTCAQRSIKFYYNDALSVMKITASEFSRTEATHEDTLGIVDKGLGIADVEVVVILIEKEPNKIYCSMRSKSNINLTEVAQHFGGGGNGTMAAFQHDGNLKEFTEEIVEYLKPFMPERPKEDICEYFI